MAGDEGGKKSVTQAQKRHVVIRGRKR